MVRLFWPEPKAPELFCDRASFEERTVDHLLPDPRFMQSIDET